MNKKMNISILLLILVLSGNVFSQTTSPNKAQGFFLAVGVGPRIPVMEFSDQSDLGYGFNLEFSYADSDVLPLFLFVTIGYEQYPGSQEYYKETDYSNFHTNSVPITLGGRYYFSPLLENIFLFMPLLQASINFNYYEKLHQFKSDSGRNNFLEDKSKFGFSAGAGVSMFMMEILTSYNYYELNQFISIDLKVRIPLFITF
jgi:opacity protein-like surface antigen